MSVAVVILAAGRSTRMQSLTSKLFHKVGGLAVASHIENSVSSIKDAFHLWVVSKSLSSHPFFSNKQDNIVVQDEPKGTGHALSVAFNHLLENNKNVDTILLVSGDTPLLQGETLSLLLKEHLKEKAALSLVGFALNAEKVEKATYGRLIVDGNNRLVCVCEYKDADSSIRKNPLMNGGVYAFSCHFLKQELHKLNNHNTQNEYYLTDLVSLAYENKHNSQFILKDEEEFYGINTRADLSLVETCYQNRLREKIMNGGVTLEDPASTYFSYDTIIENDVVVEPCVRLGPCVHIETGTRLRSFSYVEHSKIGAHSVIGPFAHLRGGCDLGSQTEIGNFVEFKGTKTENQVKVKHLSYIGDAFIGQSTNIGAGTITCNYDGYKKHKTTIGNNVFVGSNSTLVAPIQIENNAYIGAGSVLPKGTIPSNSLALSRATLTIKQRNKKEAQ